ncbi:class I SAM-dependent methyltransferase [Candidatus Daviesbacteria bacterium]|nr:class I SAM-dependent methyltransferase [Candidatus Daviesbacteria bacterium]
MADPILLATFITITLCCIGLSWFAGSDAPYVATKMDNIKDILKRAGTGKNKIFYELGSGDGRVVIEAAKLGARANGVEQSWIRVWYSRYKARQLRLNAVFFHGNIFDRSYFPADIVYIYLLSNAVQRLEGKLKKELKQGSIVITQTYHFKKWRPFKKAGDFWLYKV